MNDGQIDGQEPSGRDGVMPDGNLEPRVVELVVLSLEDGARVSLKTELHISKPVAECSVSLGKYRQAIAYGK